MGDQATFSLTTKKDYIYLKTRGGLDEDNVTAPTDAAIALAKEKNIRKLLDNIQEVDFSTASLSVQAKGMGVLWRLRYFKKVAIVLKGEEAAFLFFSSIQELQLGLGHRFQGFDNEADAVRWLQASPVPAAERKS